MHNFLTLGKSGKFLVADLIFSWDFSKKDNWYISIFFVSSMRLLYAEKLPAFNYQIKSTQ